MRNEINDALLARIATVGLLKRCERVLKHWTEVDSSDQPAAFLPIPTESFRADPSGMDTYRRFKFTLWIYVHGDDTSTELCSVLDAVEAALAPQPLIDRSMERTTLGGLVHNVQIEGDIDTDEGFLSPQGFARIPIVVLIP